MNPAAVYAFVCGPLVALLAALVPIPLRPRKAPGDSHPVWFALGVGWLVVYILGVAGFTFWWVRPAHWWGYISWGNLGLPIWIFGMGTLVAIVRLARRVPLRYR